MDCLILLPFFFCKLNYPTKLTSNLAAFRPSFRTGGFGFISGRKKKKAGFRFIGKFALAENK